MSYAENSCIEPRKVWNGFYNSELDDRRFAVSMVKDVFADFLEILEEVFF